MVAKSVRFYGTVQGVNFRRNTRSTAERSNVYGWIRNLPDGSVEGLFCGSEESVYQMIQHCLHEIPSADVTSYTIEDAEDCDSKRFDIL